MTEDPVEPGAGRVVQLGPVLTGISNTLAVTLTLGSLAWAADLYRMAGLVLYNEQHIAIALAMAVPLLYLTVPARKGPRTHVPWYDIAAAVLGAATSCYLAIRYPTLVDTMMDLTVDGLLVSGIMIVLCLEGLRRTVGKTLAVVTLLLFGYAMIGHSVPGVLQTKEVSAERLIIYLGLDTSSMLGIPMLIVATIVIGFVFFGQALQKSGGGDFFNDLALALMGRYRGGSAKIAIVASSLFGSISGVVVSNIMATGTMTIPMMKRSGYSAESAAAIEAVASTGGQLMPPVMGAAAFFMAERLQVPYSSVAIAAAVPAVLYYLALFIQADLEAARDGIKAVSTTEIPSVWKVLRDGGMLIAPFAVIIVGLFNLNLQPAVAALYGSLTAIGVGLLRGYAGRRMAWKDIVSAVIETSKGVLDIFMIGAAAGFIIGAIGITGLGFGLTIMLVEIGAKHVFFLLLIAAALCIVFGMGLPTIGVYLLLSVLVAPSLEEAGIQPMAAHMLILYFGMMSMITPPLAIAAFFAAALAGADAVKTAFTAMRFGWTAYVVPFLFVGTSTLLLKGSVGMILFNVATAALGIWVVSIGLTKYLYRPITGWKRWGFIIFGLLLLLPVNLRPWAIWVNLTGLAVAVLLVAVEWRTSRVAEPTAT